MLRGVSPNVHEIFTVLNGGDFGVIVDASCGVVRVTDDFMYRIRPVIHDHRDFLVLSVDVLARKVAVLLRSASDFVQPDAFNAFSVAASRIATHYDPSRVLPVAPLCLVMSATASRKQALLNCAAIRSHQLRRCRF